MNQYIFGICYSSLLSVILLFLRFSLCKKEEPKHQTTIFLYYSFRGDEKEIYENQNKKLPIIVRILMKEEGEK